MTSKSRKCGASSTSWGSISSLRNSDRIGRARLPISPAFLALFVAGSRRRQSDRRMEKLTGALDAHQRQEREAGEIARFDPRIDHETVERVVKEIIRAGGCSEYAEQRRPSAVENGHECERQEIKKDRMIRSDCRQLEVPQHECHGRYNRKHHSTRHCPLEKHDVFPTSRRAFL